MKTMLNQFLGKAAYWFVDIKAHDLKQKVNEGLALITEGNPLSDNYKRLFGFILFDYSMHRGPISFFEAEETAREIGVLNEMKEYAESWIRYNESWGNIKLYV